MHLFKKILGYTLLGAYAYLLFETNNLPQAIPLAVLSVLVFCTDVKHQLAPIAAILTLGVLTTFIIESTAGEPQAWLRERMVTPWDFFAISLMAAWLVRKHRGVSGIEFATLLIVTVSITASLLYLSLFIGWRAWEIGFASGIIFVATFVGSYRFAFDNPFKSMQKLLRRSLLIAISLLVLGCYALAGSYGMKNLLGLNLLLVNALSCLFWLGASLSNLTGNALNRSLLDRLAYTAGKPVVVAGVEFKKAPKPKQIRSAEPVMNESIFMPDMEEQ